MKQAGLIGVDNPSELFLSERSLGASGSVVTASLEGSRPLLVELQARVTQSSFGVPRRTTIGVDHNRLALLVAVASSHLDKGIAPQTVVLGEVGLAGEVRAITQPRQKNGDFKPALSRWAI